MSRRPPRATREGGAPQPQAPAAHRAGRRAAGELQPGPWPLRERNLQGREVEDGETKIMSTQSTNENANKITGTSKRKLEINMPEIAKALKGDNPEE